MNGKLDISYRYKMPKLKINHTGSGKNCKTVIMNLTKISDCIGCPPNILLAFLSFKCGSSMDKINESIKGHYNNTDLQNHIFIYINTFVMCLCGIPELVPMLEKKSKKKTVLKLKCSACGNIMESKNDKVSSKIEEHIKKSLRNNKWKIRKGMIVNNEDNNSSVDLFSL